MKGEGGKGGCRGLSQQTFFLRQRLEPSRESPRTAPDEKEKGLIGEEEVFELAAEGKVDDSGKRRGKKRHGPKAKGAPEPLLLRPPPSFLGDWAGTGFNGLEMGVAATSHFVKWIAATQPPPGGVLPDYHP